MLGPVRPPFVCGGGGTYRRVMAGRQKVIGGTEITNMYDSLSLGLTLFKKTMLNIATISAAYFHLNMADMF